MTYYGAECPLAKGPVMIKYDITLSSILPPILGNSGFHYYLTDGHGKQIACAKVKLAVPVLADAMDNAVSNHTIV